MQNPKEVITGFVTLVFVSLVIWLASLIGITIDNPETIALAGAALIAFVANWLHGRYRKLHNSDNEKWVETNIDGKDAFVKEKQ